ncbi:hypothetical protein C3F00_032975 [Pseudomonas sp. MWU13-2860]|nr:hypothetical protein C3F00_032975 [Pseudomonas sp. MWU13-2860]
MNQASEKALVVLSGGQDSTTCLYWALRRFGAGNVEAVTFDYGQRHRVELAAAKKIAALAGVRQTVLPIDTFAAIGGTCFGMWLTLKSSQLIAQRLGRGGREVMTRLMGFLLICIGVQFVGSGIRTFMAGS